MRAEFKKITIDNFLSIGHAEIDLDANGYVLVSGINNCSSDDAKSNGSGKSSIWEALSWVLTGTTTRGLSKDITNIYADDGALVELLLEVDGTEYKILRARDHSVWKTNLKIYVNGEDKSGKGLRDTEEILKKYLPYFHTQLINSVIILGQGLPQRFSNNTPAGRKAVLENLSETDFMISDLKTRIGIRTNKLEKDLREAEDNRLSASSRKIMCERNLSDVESSLSQLTDKQAIKDKICGLQNDLDALSQDKVVLSEQLEENEKQLNEYRAQYTDLNDKQNEEVDGLKKTHDSIYTPLYEHTAELRAERSSLTQEIFKLKSVKTVCPTCGQKLPNVSVIDTKEQEKRVEELNNIIAEKDNEIKQLIEDFQANNKKIVDKYVEKKNELQKTAENLKTEINSKNNHIKEIDKEYLSKSNEYNKLNVELSAYTENLKRLNEQREKLNKEIENTDKEILYINTEIDTINLRLETVKKFFTAVCRDFRGYLLTGVINYINKKAKEYSAEVFGTTNIALEIDGNDITISYNNKQYESLSGGEKQKVDIILQLAIRDMLCQYVGFSSNIIVIDEIFDNLDTIGCQKVLNLFANKLQDVSSVYIITHHADELEIPYDKEIVVVKNETGISMIQ